MHERLQRVGEAIKRVAGLPAYLRDLYTAYDILIDPRSRRLVLAGMFRQAERGHDLSERPTLQFLPEEIQKQVKEGIRQALTADKGGK